MTSIISPASRKDIADKLFSDFNLAYAGHSNGNYTVLRKPFENFRSYNDKFNALTSAFKRLYERASQEPISVLDIGCGAGYAIRQAIRDLEAQTNQPHSAVGITANVDYLKPFLHFSGLPSASLEGIFPGGYVLRTPKGSSIGFFTHGLLLTVCKQKHVGT